MFLLSIKLDRVSFETKGRQNLQKTTDFLIESIESFALLFRHIGFLLLTPLPLCMHQQSMSHISMVISQGVYTTKTHLLPPPVCRQQHSNLPCFWLQGLFESAISRYIK